MTVGCVIWKSQGLQVKTTYEEVAVTRNGAVTDDNLQKQTNHHPKLVKYNNVALLTAYRKIYLQYQPHCCNWPDTGLQNIWKKTVVYFLLFLHYVYAERNCWVLSNLASYMEDSGLKSRPGDLLSRLFHGFTHSLQGNIRRGNLNKATNSSFQISSI